MPTRDELRAAIAREQALILRLEREREEAQARVRSLHAALDGSAEGAEQASAGTSSPATSAEKVALFRSLFRGRNDAFAGMHLPVVAIGGGALGFWATLRYVWPKTCEQRDWGGHNPHRGAVPTPAVVATTSSTNDPTPRTGHCQDRPRRQEIGRRGSLGRSRPA